MQAEQDGRWGAFRIGVGERLHTTEAGGRCPGWRVALIAGLTLVMGGLAAAQPPQRSALRSQPAAEKPLVLPEPTVSLSDMNRSLRSLGEHTLNLSQSPGLFPPDLFDEHPLRTDVTGPFVRRRRDDWQFAFSWSSSQLVNQPLYFQEVQLERYGRGFSPLVQPVVSGAHFFKNAVVWPVRMTVNRPNRLVYTLGYGRPGD